jgi:TM2 domain-containing membrane protein YozV
MSGPGSTGNIIAAVCSFFIPGLGQLVQGRILTAILHVVICVILWFFALGWIMHIWSCISAAMYKRG